MKTKGFFQVEIIILFQSALSDSFEYLCYGYTSPRARGVLFVLKGPYDPRVPPIAKFSQESESARLTKIILSKSTVKTL